MKILKKIWAAGICVLAVSSVIAEDKLSDYLAQINEIKQLEIEAEADFDLLYNAALNSSNMDFQEELRNISHYEIKGWETDDEYAERINKEVDTARTKHAKEQENIKNEIKANYITKKDNLASRKQEIVSKMMHKEFVYSDSSVQVLIGNFNREEKYWPVVVKSLEKDLDFTSQTLQFAPNKEVIAEQFPKIQKLIDSKAITAEIYFKVEKKFVTDTYQKNVTHIILRGPDNAVLYVFDIDEVAESFALTETVYEPSSVIPED